MAGWRIVLMKIVAMFLVIMVGWIARRRKALNAETTAILSLFLVDVVFPAYVFVQMLKCVDGPFLRQNWYLCVIAPAILVLGEIVGLLIAGLFAHKEQRLTFIFLVSIANWVYLPLPIAEGLYRQEGVRVILLCNAGAQLALWSMGVWTLRGGRPDLESVKNLLKNPGLLATAGGIALALAWPGAAALARHDPAPDASALAFSFRAICQALDLVGDLVMGLSLIVTGAQLGGLQFSDNRDWRAQTGVTFGRLLLTPLVTIGLVQLARMGGWEIPEMPRMLMYIIAFMPVAISCSIFTERFGGDTALAARAIFYTTFLSIGTVPAFYYVVQRLKL